MKKPELSIIIPVRNEGKNLKVILNILLSALEAECEVLVVYDTNDDDSIPVVKNIKRKNNQIRLVHNSSRGVSNAIKTGVSQARSEYVLLFVADDVGPVLAVDDMLILAKQGCDLVSATRYCYGGRRLGGSLIEGFLSRIGNKLLHAIVGLTLTDSTTGIKMIRKDLFQKIELKSNVGWAIVFELAIKIQMLGGKVGEVPIVSIDRLYGGVSSFKLSSWFNEYFKWFLYGVKNLRKIKKRKVLVRIPSTI